MKAAWEWFKGTKWWAKALMGFGALIILAAIFGEDPEEQAKSDEPPAAAKAPAPTEESGTEPAADEAPEPEPEPEPAPDPTAELKAAIEDAPDTVQDPKVKDIMLDGLGLLVFLETPEGGLEGPSTRDLNEQARAVFLAAHHQDVPKRGRTVIKVTGGLVDTTTGNELPNKLTAEYSLTKQQARQINWDDDDAVKYVIDWSFYRDYVHPAIKMDD